MSMSNYQSIVGKYANYQQYKSQSQRLEKIISSRNNIKLDIKQKPSSIQNKIQIPMNVKGSTKVVEKSYLKYKYQKKVEACFQKRNFINDNQKSNYLNYYPTIVQIPKNQKKFYQFQKQKIDFKQGGFKNIYIQKNQNYVDAYVQKEHGKEFQKNILNNHKKIAQNQHKLGDNNRLVKVIHVQTDKNNDNYIRLQKFEAILSNQGQLNSVQTKYLARDAIKGLSDLKKCGFINHGDIKPNNIAHLKKQGVFKLNDYDDCMLKKSQPDAVYTPKLTNQDCYYDEKACSDRNQQYFKQRDLKAVGNLIKIVSQDQQTTKQIMDIIKDNKKKSYQEVVKKIQDQLILKQYRQKIKEQFNAQLVGSTCSIIINIITTLRQKSADFDRASKKQSGQEEVKPKIDDYAKEFFKELGKGAVSYAAIFGKKMYTQAKIKSSYHHHQYRLGKIQTAGIGIAVQMGKGIVQYFFSDKQVHIEEIVEKVVRNVAASLIYQASSYAVSWGIQKVTQTAKYILSSDYTSFQHNCCNAKNVLTKNINLYISGLKLRVAINRYNFAANSPSNINLAASSVISSGFKGLAQSGFKEVYQLGFKGVYQLGFKGVYQLAFKGVTQKILKQTFKSCGKNSVVGGIASFAAGTCMDLYQGKKQLGTILIQNAKKAGVSSVGNFIGSSIGTIIAPGIGTTIGGIVGSFLSSFF